MKKDGDIFKNVNEENHLAIYLFNSLEKIFLDPRLVILC